MAGTGGYNVDVLCMYELWTEGGSALKNPGCVGCSEEGRGWFDKLEVAVRWFRPARFGRLSIGLRRLGFLESISSLTPCSIARSRSKRGSGWRSGSMKAELRI